MILTTCAACAAPLAHDAPRCVRCKLRYCNKTCQHEAEENNLDEKRGAERWRRWNTCSMCEQQYHGVVRCALGWACWKTYVGRPEADRCRRMAMTQLGNGLYNADHNEEALSVMEAKLSMLKRLGASEDQMLVIQGNLACTYQELGRLEEAMCLRRDVYSGRLKLNGEEDGETIREASNYASTLMELERFAEMKPLMRKLLPVARRVLGESQELTLKMRWTYARALYGDPGATLDDLRESVETLQETAKIMRQVFGGTHPLTVGVEKALRESRDALAARETPP